MPLRPLSTSQDNRLPTSREALDLKILMSEPKALLGTLKKLNLQRGHPGTTPELYATAIYKAHSKNHVYSIALTKLMEQQRLLFILLLLLLLLLLLVPVNSVLIPVPRPEPAPAPVPPNSHYNYHYRCCTAATTNATATARSVQELARLVLVC